MDQYCFETLLNVNNRKEIKHQGEIRGYMYPTAEAGKIVQFVCSVLWRASISKQRFFRQVSLGPYEQKMLTAAVDGYVPKSISVTITEFKNVPIPGGQVPTAGPRKLRCDGVNMYALYANRFCFYVRTDQRKYSKLEDLGLTLEVRKKVHSFAISYLDSIEHDAALESVHNASAGRMAPRGFPRDNKFG